MINGTSFMSFDEEYPLLMPKWGYVASAFVLFLIGFFGFFLNLMVILLMMKDRQLWTPLNMILFNLVCSDFCVSIVGNPLTLISALFHHWVFGQTVCVMYGFFMALLGISSITSLTVLSFERYLMVTRPLSSRHRTPGSACLTILFIWTYSLALTTPPLMGWGNYVNEAANISCSVNWHEQSTNTLTYILFLFAMGQILPFAVITFSYLNIMRTIKKNSQRMGRVGKAEGKVTVMVLVMIIAFTVAWTPYSIFALMEQFASQGVISPGLGVIPALVAKSSICYDPIIYIGMNTQFRQSIKKLFSGRSKGNASHTERAMDNTLVSPAHKGSKVQITRRNSSVSNVSTTTKKHVVFVDKKAFIRDLHSPIDDSNNPFIKNGLNTIQESRLSIDAGKSIELILDGKGNLDAKNRILKYSGDSSTVITIDEPESLPFHKCDRAFTNDAFEHAQETECSQKSSNDESDEVFDREQCCSMDLGNTSSASATATTPELHLTLETNLDTATDYRYVRRFSLRNKMPLLNKRSTVEEKDSLNNSGNAYV